MASIPALRAHTGTVFALSVFRASGVAGQLIAEIASPAGITAALARLTDAVGTAVQTANSCKETNVKYKYYL